MDKRQLARVQTPLPTMQVLGSELKSYWVISLAFYCSVLDIYPHCVCPSCFSRGHCFNALTPLYCLFRRQATNCLSTYLSVFPVQTVSLNAGRKRLWRETFYQVQCHDTEGVSKDGVPSSTHHVSQTAWVYCWRRTFAPITLGLSHKWRAVFPPVTVDLLHK